MTISVRTKIDLEDLALDLAMSCNHEALIKFIMDIDEQVAEWEFTEKLHKRVSVEMERIHE